LITADDLKRFTENLCNENYPLSDALEAEVNELERRWPCFKETDCEEQNPTMEWGNFRYGRIPPFVWNDTGADYSSIKPSMSPSSAKVLQEELHSDALAYQTQFARALQENLKCVQHHIHPKKSDPKKKSGSQKRTIPNACLSSKSGKECKAGFPMDNRLNFGRPVLLCKGLAKERKLPWKGRRSVLGQILGKRNSPWLNGTAPGLAIALSGSNSDVKINDLANHRAHTRKLRMQPRLHTKRCNKARPCDAPTCTTGQSIAESTKWLLWWLHLQTTKNWEARSTQVHRENAQTPRIAQRKVRRSATTGCLRPYDN